MKGKPAGWIMFLKTHMAVHLDANDVARFCERKAARDVLEHHNGIVDPSYLEKVGSVAQFKVGDLFDPDDAAVDEVYDLVKGLIARSASDAEQELGRLQKSKP
jgi:hypothetical protein